jgi:alkylresorcinol/alkylpyrone synthase
MSVIVSTQTGFPEYYYPQTMLLAAAQGEWKKKRASIVKPLEQFYTNVQVNGRYLAWPLEQYIEPATFEERNDAYIETALALGEQTICDLLDRVQMSPGEIDQLTVISTTGIAVPSLDARLMNRIPFSRGMKRHPNYLGVELEILAAPLVHSAWLTSAAFGAANLLLLRERIRREEGALQAFKSA